MCYRGGGIYIYALNDVNISNVNIPWRSYRLINAYLHIDNNIDIYIVLHKYIMGIIEIVLHTYEYKTYSNIH